MTFKTLEANSIPIPPQLAGLLKQTLGRSGNGFDEAAFLQQIHYWTTISQTTGNNSHFGEKLFKPWECRYCKDI